MVLRSRRPLQSRPFDIAVGWLDVRHADRLRFEYLCLPPTRSPPKPLQLLYLCGGCLAREPHTPPRVCVCVCVCVYHPRSGQRVRVCPSVPRACVRA